MEDYDYYGKLVMENTGYVFLVEQNPNSKEEIKEIIRLIIDVICFPRPTIRVNGADVPHEVVKSVFLKLNENHIEYVLAALKKNTSDVYNIRSYLLTTLYNAPTTMSSYWNAVVNHDMYNGK